MAKLESVPGLTAAIDAAEAAVAEIRARQAMAGWSDDPGSDWRGLGREAEALQSEAMRLRELALRTLDESPGSSGALIELRAALAEAARARETARRATARVRDVSRYVSAVARVVSRAGSLLA